MNIPDEWQVAFESGSPRECSDRALVLHALDIPYEIVTTGERSLLLVHESMIEKARFELWQYDQENRAPDVHRALRPIREAHALGLRIMIKPRGHAAPGSCRSTRTAFRASSSMSR